MEKISLEDVHFCPINVTYGTKMHNGKEKDANGFRLKENMKTTVKRKSSMSATTSGRNKKAWKVWK